MRVRWMFAIAVWLLAGLAHGGAQTPALAAEPVRTYGISLLGEPKLPADFRNFPYVNPDAPKGGEVALSTVGTFDSFNPFIVRGTAAPPTSFRGLGHADCRPNADEAETEYGHLAAGDRVAGRPHRRRVRVAAARRKFNDGTPVTAEDVAWTFDTLREQGPAVLPAVLCRRRLGDGRRTAPGGVPLQVQHSTASCR